MRRHDDNTMDAMGAEAVARASFLRMTRRKWRLVQAFEAITGLVMPMLRTRQAAQKADERPASILVIEYWNLGDLAILVPFLRNLRQRFPDARISLLVQAGLESFLEGQGIVDEFFPVRVPWAQHFNRWRKYNPFSRHWISLARSLVALRRRQFDWAFSGRMDVRDNFMLWASGARRRIGYGIGGGGQFLTDRVAPDLSRPHRAEIWQHLLQSMGELPNREPGGFRLRGAEIEHARSFLSSHGIPPGAFLIGVHPGARIPTRRWGEERFAEVARRILSETDAHVLWFCEPGNSSHVPTMKRIHAVSLDFRSFLAVLSRCRLLVCNDSGPMHFASLLNVPVVAVFGPTQPKWFGPRGEHDRVVIHPEFSCRPCFDYCIFDQPYCLRIISCDEVCDAVKRLLWPIARPVRKRRDARLWMN
ncbi:MAG: glycosyltransferase family 9 protein [Candidatus Acidiferrum sp.]